MATFLFNPLHNHGTTADAVANSVNQAGVYAPNGKYDFRIPRDAGIITNKSGDPIALQNGESIIYLGGSFLDGTQFANDNEARFWGFSSEPKPFPLNLNPGTRVRTLNQWITQVASWVANDGVSGAYLQPVRQSLEQIDLRDPTTGAEIALDPAF